MSIEEKKFDDLLRSKLSERDFFFDELNWQKAEAMLAREEKLRKVKRTYYVFIAGFILGAAVMFPIIMAITTGKQIIASKSTPVAANENKIQTNSGNRVNTVASTNLANAGQTNASAPIASGEKDKNIKTSANTTAPVKEAATHKNENPASNATNYAYVRPASERKHKNQKVDLIASSNRAHPQNQNSSNTLSNQSFQNQQSNNSVAQNNATNNNGIVPNNSKSVSNNSVSTGNSNNSIAATNDATQANNTAPSINNNVSSNSNSNNKITATTNSAQANNNSSTAQPNSNNNKNQALTATNNSSPQKNDTASNTTAKSDSNTATIVPDQYKSQPASNIISADAGLGYSFGWKNQGINSGNGISPVIGVILRHLFSNKWSLYLGLRYNSLTNLKNQYQASSASYDFGLNNSVTSVTTKTLYYGALPLGVQYNFNAKNAVSLGGTLLYLINTKSTVSTSTQDGLKSPTDQNKTTFGYMDGFNQWDVQMVIAYRRRLFKAFYISTEGYYGLMDVEKNSFFMSNTFERNMGLRLILSYDFIK